MLSDPSIDSNSDSDLENEEEKIVLHVYDDESKEFTSLTTYHGMIRIYTSETWPSRIFWGVVVVTCVTLFMIQGGVLLEFYNSHPTAIKTLEIFIPRYYLPSVSICPNGLKRDDRNISDLLLRMNQSRNELSAYRNISSKSIILKNSFLCEDVIDSFITDHGEKGNFCETAKVKLSSVGICFTFENWNEMSTMSLKIKLNDSFRKKFTAHVHDASDDASHLTNQFRLETGKTSRISFSIEEKNSLPYNDWGSCNHEKSYNYFTCLNKCLIAGYSEGCGCQPFFDDSVEKHCSIGQISNCSGMKLVTCDCPVQCQMRNYVFQPLTSLANRKNETTLTFHLNSMRMKKHQQYKRFKQIDLMSYIGGVMGLFLGMSCITLLEVFVYLFKTVFGTLNDARHKEFLQRPLSNASSINGSHEEIVITKKTNKSTNNSFPEKKNDEIEMTTPLVTSRKVSLLPQSNPMSVKVTVLRKKAKSFPETGITENSGYYSLSIIYFFFSFFNVVIPAAVKKFGAKWSQIIGATGYLFFMLTFFHLNVYLLYFGSAVLGVSAALLWAGSGCYLINASRPSKMERNSGILWAMIQSSLITGGFFLIYVLRSGNLEESFTTIYVAFSIITALGIAILLFLPNSPLQYAVQLDAESDTETPLIASDSEDNAQLSFVENLRKTVSLLWSPKISCFYALFIYSGLETTFYTGVYTSCLSATSSLNSSDLIIPLNALSIGTGQIIGGLLTGSVGKMMQLSSQQIILLAFLGHMISFSLTFLCLPFDSTIHSTSASTYIEPNLVVVLVISFLLGISDAFWQTQIYVTIGQFFKHDPASAFAIFKFFQSLSACISFFYSSFLLLPWQLLILASGCTLSMISFLKVRGPITALDSDAVLSVRS